MPSETAEDYLKAVLSLGRESPTGEAAMSRIAAIVGVTTGTATTMIKKLAAAKLVRYERFGGVKLTSTGEHAALNVLRRHRLVETFLVETLKLDWSVVHAEAERLEHAVSPLVLEALDNFLGRPGVDPHGDPIPDSKGRTPTRRGRPLSAFAAGARVRVLRIADQDPAFLTFAGRHGLRPGAVAVILATDDAAQAVLVQAGEQPSVSMAHTAAGRILCEPASK